MADDTNQLSEHLRFFGELGVSGVSRDPAWRRRPSSVVRVDPAARRAALDGAPEGGDPAVHRAPLDGAPEGGDPAARRAPLDGAPEGGDSAARRAALDGAPEGGDLAARRAPLYGAPGLAVIRTDLGEDCSRCKLHTLGRKQIVFGVGNPNADLMFVGEAPGADEDEQGIPFVGRAGQLLTKMIAAMGFDRDQVYIANVIKCRPPQNRPPEPDEIASCEPFLFRQIDAIAPKVIVALGSFAAKTLLATDQSISRLRGRVYDFRGVKLVPTFHPSYLLRSPDKKREAWEDLKTARALLGTLRCEASP